MKLKRPTEVDEDIRSFLINVLILAADRYALDARVCANDATPGARSLAPQFERQERQARALVDIIGEVEEIAVAGDGADVMIAEWSKL